MVGAGIDIALAVKAMQAGAVDFLQKPADRRIVLEAVEAAFATIADREALCNRAQWARTQLGHLTMREQEVLDGLACGYPNKTIAYDLGISPRTLRYKLAKLKAENSTMAWAA